MRDGRCWRPHRTCDGGYRRHGIALWRYRRHRPYADSVEELYTALTDAFAGGGNVIIPTFALERAQEILYVLRQGIEQNRLPPSMSVFLDSPLAIAATEIFRRHPDYYSASVGRLFANGVDPLGFRTCI